MFHRGQRASGLRLRGGARKVAGGPGYAKIAPILLTFPHSSCSTACKEAASAPPPSTYIKKRGEQKCPKA